MNVRNENELRCHASFLQGKAEGLRAAVAVCKSRGSDNELELALVEVELAQLAHQADERADRIDIAANQIVMARRNRRA